MQFTLNLFLALSIFSLAVNAVPVADGALGEWLNICLVARVTDRPYYGSPRCRCLHERGDRQPLARGLFLNGKYPRRAPRLLSLIAQTDVVSP